MNIQQLTRPKQGWMLGLIAGGVLQVGVNK